MESLSTEIFCVILGHLNMKDRASVPLCSRSCHHLFLDYLRVKVPCLSASFIYPFQHEEGASLPEKYADLTTALSRCFSEYHTLGQMILRFEDNGSALLRGEPKRRVEAERALLDQARRLLGRNLVRHSAASIWGECSLALGEAIRAEVRDMPFEGRGVTGPDPDLVILARPLLEIAFRKICEAAAWTSEEEVGAAEALNGGNGDEAGRLRKKAIEHSDHAAIRCYYSQICSDPPDEEAAEATLRRSLEVEPGNLESRLNLAQVLRRKGRMGDSVALIREGIDFAARKHPAYVWRLCEAATNAVQFYGVEEVQFLVKMAIDTLDRSSEKKTTNAAIIAEVKDSIEASFADLRAP